MISLADLLKNHAIPGIRQSEERHVCAASIKNLVGVTIAPKKIQLARGVLSLSVPPVLKSALLLKQVELKAILKDFNIVVTEIR